MTKNANLPETVGKNQMFTRDVNLSIIMRAFMKQSMSKVDVSRLFQLSKPTAAKIITELEELEFICEDAECDPVRNTPGAKPLKYKLNEHFGVFAVLDMSSVETHIQLCTLGGAVLSEQVFTNKELITYDDIVCFCGAIDKLYAALPRKEKLLAVCVAMPCAVNGLTGAIEWSSRFDIDEAFDLYAYLTDRYRNSEILLRNDVQLMLSGEIYGGLLSGGDIRYALLVYIDAGLGGSFYFNGEIETGEEGKAGDLGFFPYLNRNGEYMYLDSVISINAIKKDLRRELSAGKSSALKNGDIHFSDIKTAYFNKDALVKEVVENTALETAKALQSILEILNLNFIIISGRITQLGESYKTIVESTLQKRFPKVRVQYSNIQNSAIHEGALLVVSERIIEKVISTRSKKNQ